MREARSGADIAGYLPWVDGLRAVAVLSVLIYHLDSGWLPGGFVGVDVFFVISGFVVSASVARLGGATPGATTLAFYARRVRRIVPALLTCLLATSLAAALFIPDAWLSSASFDTGQLAFVGLSNWVLAGADAYFSPRAEYNPFVHTWSLGVEEQFYLVFPWLFAFWMLGVRRARSLALFALGFVASLAWAAYLGSEAARAAEAFYVTTTRFWELAAGVLLFQGLTLAGVRATSTHHVVRSAAIAVSALAVAFGVASAGEGRTPWPDSLVPVLGTVGLLGLVYASPRDGWVARALSLDPVVAVGKASYSLYLWHWPVFVVFRWTSGLETAVERLAAVTIAAGLAVASYRFVERPLRHSPSLMRLPEPRLLGATALVVLTCVLAHWGVAASSGAYSLSVVTRHAEDWYAYGGDRDVSGSGCEIDRTGRGASTVYRRIGCDAAPAGTRRIFVAGDSHAPAYAEMIRRLLLTDGGEASVFSITECPAPSAQGEPLDCERAVERAYATSAADAGAGDVLFLPRLRLPRLGEQWPLEDEGRVVGDPPPAAAVSVSWEDAAYAELEPLAARGVRIVFEAPKPLFRAPAFRCSDWFNRANPICEPGLTVERAFLEAYRAPVVESLHRLAARLPGATVWDPFPVLCPDVLCEAVRDGRPLFFDGDHVSGYANRLLLPSFSAHLDGLAPPEA